ncbi:MAG: TolC family protein [Vampirovibrionales bacterium]
MTSAFFLLPLDLRAETLNWQDFQTQIQSNTFALRQERLDVDIAKEAVKDSKTQYLPSLNLQVNSERLQTLTNRPINSANTPNIGGNTFILNNDAIQHSAGLNGQWTVLDFGKRKSQVEQNKAAVEAERYDALNKQYRLLLRALPLYAQLWEWQQEQYLQTDQLRLQKEKLAYYKRLYESGKLGKLALYEAEMKVLTLQQQVETLAFSIVDGFQKLQIQTQIKIAEPYPDLSIPNLAHQGQDPEEATSVKPPVSLEQSAHVKELEYRIRQKEHEIIGIKRQRWTPNILVYGTVVAFGTDPSSVSQSLSNITWRNARIGWSLQMPLTQAFSLKFNEKKAFLEKERLLLEKEASLWEAQETQWQLKEAERLSTAKEKQLLATERMLKNLQLAADRLKTQGVLTPLESLDVAIRRNQQALDRVKLQSEQWQIQEKKLLLASSVVPVTPTPVSDKKSSSFGFNRKAL